VAALPAEGSADPREEQPEEVVDLRRGADRRSARHRGVALLNRDGGRDALEPVDQRLGHALEELLGVGRERFDVAALAFGVEVSNARLLFPEPDGPVTTTRLRRGMSTVMPLRLCWRALTIRKTESATHEE
jgi:hypothetical protein